MFAAARACGADAGAVDVGRGGGIELGHGTGLDHVHAHPPSGPEVGRGEPDERCM